MNKLFELIDALVINPVEEVKKKTRFTKLKGSTISVTGTLELGSREVFISECTSHGLIYKDTITKKLDYLVAGVKTESDSKIAKAASNGTTILFEADFLELLKELS